MSLVSDEDDITDLIIEDNRRQSGQIFLQDLGEFVKNLVTKLTKSGHSITRRHLAFLLSEQGSWKSDIDRLKAFSFS